MENAAQKAQVSNSLTDKHIYVRYGESNINEIIKSMMLREIESEHDVKNVPNS